MDKAQAAAFIYAQSVCALAEIEAMKAANHERAEQNYALAYNETDFRDVPNRYGISHNAALQLLMNASS